MQPLALKEGKEIDTEVIVSSNKCFLLDTRAKPDWQSLSVSFVRSLHSNQVPGVYQIGLVYARSCNCIAVPSGMSTLKNFAS